MPNSVEIFTPNSETLSQQVTSNLIDLQALGLKLCSITHSLRDMNAAKSTQFLKTLRTKTDLEFIMHLTATATTDEGLMRRLTEWKILGVEKILRLRGDLPASKNNNVSDQLRHSSIRLIRKAKAAGFEPWTSAYPTPHHLSPHEQSGLDWTYKKLDAGATTLVTQFCFDTEKIVGWATSIRERYPDTKIRIGILPIRSVGQISRIHKLNHMEVPEKLAQFCNRYADENGNIPMAATQKYIWQSCRELTWQANLDFHFYSFNQLAPTNWAFQQDFSTAPKQQPTHKEKPHDDTKRHAA